MTPKRPKCHQNGSKKEALGPKRPPKSQPGGLWDAIGAPKVQNVQKRVKWPTPFSTILAPKWHPRASKKACQKTTTKQDEILWISDSFQAAKMKQNMSKSHSKNNTQMHRSFHTFDTTKKKRKRDRDHEKTLKTSGKHSTRRKSHFWQCRTK